MCEHKSCPKSGPCQEERREERRPKPNKIKSPIKRSKRVRPVSQKRAKQNKAYAAEREILAHKEKNQVCAVAQMAGSLTPEQRDIFKECRYFSCDYHHPAGRGGDNFLPTEDGKWLCRSCHRICEEKPLVAKALNLSVSRLNKNI